LHENGKELNAIFRKRDLVPVQFEKFPEFISYTLVVIYNQYVLHGIQYNSSKPKKRDLSKRSHGMTENNMAMNTQIGYTGSHERNTRPAD